MECGTCVVDMDDTTASRITRGQALGLPVSSLDRFPVRVGRPTLNITDAASWADVPNCIKSRMLTEPSVHCPRFPDCPCSMSDNLIPCLPRHDEPPSECEPYP